MKAYSIGRDPSCNIVINDCTNVISRRHATLNVSSNGKMTITDQSSNGTYVNGIRITPNVAVPVTRKDIISLAHVSQLDWNSIPKSDNWKIYAISAFTVLLISGISYFLIFQDYGSNNNTNEKEPVVAADTLKNIVAPIDTTQTKEKEAEKGEKKDSINSTENDKKKQPKKTEPKQEDKKEDKKEAAPKNRPVI